MWKEIFNLPIKLYSQKPSDVDNVRAYQHALAIEVVRQQLRWSVRCRGGEDLAWDKSKRHRKDVRMWHEEKEKCKKKHKSILQPRQAQASFSPPSFMACVRWCSKIQLLCSLLTSTSALGTKHFLLLRIEASRGGTFLCILSQ